MLYNGNNYGSVCLLAKPQGVDGISNVQSWPTFLKIGFVIVGVFHHRFYPHLECKNEIFFKFYKKLLYSPIHLTYG